jgi:hypothetical protein
MFENTSTSEITSVELCIIYLFCLAGRRRAHTPFRRGTTIGS